MVKQDPLKGRQAVRPPWKANGQRIYEGQFAVGGTSIVNKRKFVLQQHPALPQGLRQTQKATPIGRQQGWTTSSTATRPYGQPGTRPRNFLRL